MSKRNGRRKRGKYVGPKKNDPVAHFMVTISLRMNERDVVLAANLPAEKLLDRDKTIIEHAEELRDDLHKRLIVDVVIDKRL